MPLPLDGHYMRVRSRGLARKCGRIYRRVMGNPFLVIEAKNEGVNTNLLLANGHLGVNKFFRAFRTLPALPRRLPQRFQQALHRRPQLGRPLRMPPGQLVLLALEIERSQ